jgi:acetyltransferase-like isoleucine patch superfamily enzyme
VFADQGASAVSVDFDFTGGAFTKNTNSTFTPANLTVQALVGNWGATSVSWVTSGTSTSTISTRVVANDTIFFAPSTTTSRVSLTATASSISTSTSKTVAFSVLQQPSDGVKGDRGFVPLAYIPILVDPTTATNTQLTSAWVAQTGYTPIDQDCGSFTFGSLNKAYTYNGTTWISAAVEISGDLIATGTIRANRLAANEIYTNNIASTNSTSTFQQPTGTGFWLSNNGDAYFGGDLAVGDYLSVGNNAYIGSNLRVGQNAYIDDNLTVGNNVNIGENCYIGNNLTVAGLINSGYLAPNVVTSSTLSTEVRNLITTSSGGSGAGNIGTYYDVGTKSWNSSQYDSFRSSGGLFYGYWRQVSYVDDLDTYVAAGRSLNVSCSFDLTFTGTLPYPNGPLIVLYRNGSDTNNSGQIYFQSNTYWSYYNQFGALTSYSGRQTVSGTFSFSPTKTGNVIGIGIMNGSGNSNPSIGNPGNFSVSNIVTSVTIA